MSAVAVIDSWVWPRSNSGFDVEKINRSMAKGICLFRKSTPCVETLVRKNGEEYKAVSNTDYRAVRHAEAWESDRRTIILVCRNPATWETYRAACKEAGEEARIELYLVDMDQQTCTCEAFAEAKSYCKHLLGLAYWLRLPHTISQNGVIRWKGSEHAAEHERSLEKTRMSSLVTKLKEE